MQKNPVIVKKSRGFKKEKYVFAALLTLGIFLLGVLLGLVIEGKRIIFIQNSAKEQKLDFASLQLQYAYVNQLSQEQNCPALIKTFEKNIESLESARLRLEEYNQNAKISKDDFKLLQREYILSQLSYWLFAKQTRDVCNVDQASILYFYSTKKECPDCEEQAFVLTYLKKRFNEKLLIFALNGRYTEEPMIEMLKTRYDIQVYPTLVIEDKKFEGFTSKDDILREICRYYTHEKEEDCAPFYPLYNLTNSSSV